MKRKYLIFAILLFAGYSCSVEKSSAPAYYNNYDIGFQKNSGIETGGLTASYGVLNEQSAEVSERMVLYDAYLTIAVKEPEEIADSLAVIAKTFGGYVSRSGTEYVVIRVKSEKLNEALIKIESLGKLRYKTISGNDVTEEYFDYTIRLENAEKARLRYLELLEKAENVEAALLVEKELERLNTTIDFLKGKMKNLEHLEEYSTITINIDEKKKPGILGYIGIGLYHSVKWLFVRN